MFAITGKHRSKKPKEQTPNRVAVLLGGDGEII
jgi:hypothetical protein